MLFLKVRNIPQAGPSQQTHPLAAMPFPASIYHQDSHSLTYEDRNNAYLSSNLPQYNYASAHGVGDLPEDRLHNPLSNIGEIHPEGLYGVSALNSGLPVHLQLNAEVLETNDIVTCRWEYCGGIFTHLPTLIAHIHNGSSLLYIHFGLQLSNFWTWGGSMHTHIIVRVCQGIVWQGADLSPPQTILASTNPTIPVNGVRVYEEDYHKHRVLLSYPTFDRIPERSHSSASCLVSPSHLKSLPTFF